jgi:hypothetical protein
VGGGRASCSVIPGYRYSAPLPRVRPGRAARAGQDCVGAGGAVAAKNTLAGCADVSTNSTGRGPSRIRAQKSDTGVTDTPAPRVAFARKKLSGYLSRTATHLAFVGADLSRVASGNLSHRRGARNILQPFRAKGSRSLRKKDDRAAAARARSATAAPLEAGWIRLSRAATPPAHVARAHAGCALPARPAAPASSPRSPARSGRAR